MIYQLLKRNYSPLKSKFWPALLLGFCGFFAYMFWQGKSLGAIFVFLPVYLLLLFSMGVGITRYRFKQLDLILPISSRQLFLSRAILQAVPIWLPALLVVANALVFGSWETKLASLLFLEIAAIFTAVCSLCLCYRIQYSNVPDATTGMLAGGFGVMLSIGICFFRLSDNYAVWSERLPFWLTLGLCGLATHLTLSWGLAHLPASLQFGETRKQVRDRAWNFPSPVWWPLARAIFDLNALITFLTAGLWMAGSNWMLAPFWMVSGNSGLTHRIHWLLPLPISRYRIFALAQLPGVLSLLIFPWFFPHPIRSVRFYAVQFAVVVLVAQLTVIAVTLLSLPQVKRDSFLARSILGCNVVVIFVPGIWAMFHGEATKALLISLTNYLPGSAVMFWLSLLLPVVTVCLAAARLFGRAEMSGQVRWQQLATERRSA